MSKSALYKSFLLSLLILPLASGFTKKTKITLGATDWCPYSCSNLKNQGEVPALLSKILKRHGLDLKVEFYPSARAIKLSKEGKLDGLVTASISEAKGMYRTTIPTSTYQMCFYGLKKNKWRYKVAKDLSEIALLGIIANYGYGEPLDSYISQTPENIMTISGSSPITRLMELTRLKRLSIFAEDTKVISHQAKNFLHNKGCLPKQPIYVAFSKKFKNAKKVIAILDKEFKLRQKELKLGN